MKSNLLSVLTKVFIEEGEGGQVAGQTDELSDDHEPVPRADGQRHHQELSEDQSGEGDCNHMNKLLIKQHQCSVHQDAPWWTHRGHV